MKWPESSNCGWNMHGNVRSSNIYCSYTRKAATPNPELLALVHYLSREAHEVSVAAELKFKAIHGY